MRVLVTGGAGFIGSHVVDGLLEAGHEVAVVDNLHTGKRANLNPQAAFFEIDICDRAALTQVFDSVRPEAISHQAALADVRGALLEPAAYAEVNLVGSINVLELARLYGVRKIVYASTGGAVYGEPVYLPVDEAHPVQPLDPYGASKHAVEHYLFLYKHNYGLDWVSLRYPNVYGPRQDTLGEAGVVAIFSGRMLAGQPCIIFGDGLQQRDFVYVGDVARANLLALTRGSGIYNIGSGIPTDINTVFNLLKASSGYRQEAVHGPAKLGEVRRTYLDASRAGMELGWAPTVDLADGLQRTLDFVRRGNG